MREVIRGAIVQFFDWQFRDEDKNETIPETASLFVRYLRCGCAKTDEISLTEDDGLWSAEWDSSEADPGTIYWHIRSTSPEAIAAEGEFRLRANPANPRD
jgi:hypothetical protein